MIGIDVAQADLGRVPGTWVNADDRDGDFLGISPIGLHGEPILGVPKGCGVAGSAGVIEADGFDPAVVVKTIPKSIVFDLLPPIAKAKLLEGLCSSKMKGDG